jgi:hypothetical protein
VKRRFWSSGTCCAELRTAYVGGQQEQFKLLLSQEDPRHSAACSSITRTSAARASKISEIQGIVAELDEAEKAEAADVSGSPRSRPRPPAALRGGRRARRRSRALKAMNAQIRTRNDSIAKLKREAASLES